jgi:hypothetical protein
MATTSTIIIGSKKDPKNSKGWSKYWSGYPTATIPPLVVYLRLFGWDAFVKEWERINADGGATDFFSLGYSSVQGTERANKMAKRFGLPSITSSPGVGVSGGLEDMLSTRKLTAHLRHASGDSRKLGTTDWGYVIYPDQIDIYHVLQDPSPMAGETALVQSIIPSKVKDRQLIASIFTDGPQAKIIRVLKLKDD